MKQFNAESENLNNQDKLTVVKNYLRMSDKSIHEIKSGLLYTYSKFLQQIRETLFAEFYEEEFYLSDIDDMIKSAEFMEDQHEIISTTNILGKRLELTKREAIEIKSKFDNHTHLPLKIKIDFIYHLANDFQHARGTHFFSEKTIDSFLEMFGYEITDLKILKEHGPMYQAGYIKDNTQGDLTHEDLITQSMDEGCTFEQAQRIAHDLFNEDTSNYLGMGSRVPHDKSLINQLMKDGYTFEEAQRIAHDSITQVAGNHEKLEVLDYIDEDHLDYLGEGYLDYLG